MNDIVVYTSIHGKYDSLPEIHSYDASIQYICFTDDVEFCQSSNTKGHWSVVYFKPCLSSKDCNRLIKLFPSAIIEYLDACYSIYIDANIDIVGDIRLLLKQDSCSSICTYDHQFRYTVLEEILCCAHAGHFLVTDAARIHSHIQKIYPLEPFRLQECSIIIRNHMNELTDRLGCVWWILYQNFNLQRDQCWLGMALQLTNAPHRSLGVNDSRQKKVYFSHRLNHRSKPRVKQRIYRKFNQLILRFYPNLLTTP